MGWAPTATPAWWGMWKGNAAPSRTAACPGCNPPQNHRRRCCAAPQEYWRAAGPECWPKDFKGAQLGDNWYGPDELRAVLERGGGVSARAPCVCAA